MPPRAQPGSPTGCTISHRVSRSPIHRGTRRRAGYAKAQGRNDSARYQGLDRSYSRSQAANIRPHTPAGVQWQDSQPGQGRLDQQYIQHRQGLVSRREQVQFPPSQIQDPHAGTNSDASSHRARLRSWASTIRPAADTELKKQDKRVTFPRKQTMQITWSEHALRRVKERFSHLPQFKIPNDRILQFARPPSTIALSRQLSGRDLCL